MLSVLLWILCGIGIICIIVFPGKRKDQVMLSEEKTMISDAAVNIAAVSFVLSQMLFPIFGYCHAASHPPYSSTWLSEFGNELHSVLSGINVNYLEAFNHTPGNSVYAFVIITSVFCFFAGMSLYKNGLKMKHKLFLFLPLLVLIATLIRLIIRYSYWKNLTGIFLRYETIIQIDLIERYLYGALLMIAVLYGIYLLSKKLLRNEIVPLLLILILSFFAPSIIVVRDGLSIPQPRIGHFQFGPDIPLFPIGMIVMKYKDKFLPKTKKGILIHTASWLCIGGISFFSLSSLQSFLIKQAGLRATDALTDIWSEELVDKLTTLRRIYKMDSIPWLFLGLSASMLILTLTLLIRTGNPVTKFCREHCYLLTVLLFSRHVFFATYEHDMSLWTKRFGFPKNMLIIVPFIYFAVSVVLAYLIRRFILDKRKRNGALPKESE